jgi:hypothetical protein
MHTVLCHTHAQLLTVRAIVDFAILYVYACQLILQWLRQEGADWPVELVYDGQYWPDAMIAWCRLEGCDSPLELEYDTDADDDIDDDDIDDDDIDDDELADQA